MTGGYCLYCDARDADPVSGDEGPECSRCQSILYDSKEEYVDEMVDWLGRKYGLSESRAKAFLTDHGNPGKGQAAAIIRKTDGGRECVHCGYTSFNDEIDRDEPRNVCPECGRDQ